MAGVDVRGVDFHFDIMCPYAYQTSIWIREVRGLTGLEVRWKFPGNGTGRTAGR